jgi:exopolysaccharide biosynthesis polyprenyl glycosylphosphotransferase
MDRATVDERLRSTAAAGEAWSRPRHLLANLDSVAATFTLGSGYALLVWHEVSVPQARIVHGLFQFLVGLVTLALLYRDNQYSPEHRLSRITDVASAAKNLTVAFFLVSGVSFATKGFFTGYQNLSRLVVFTNLAVFFGLLVAGRLALAAYQRALFARGEDIRSVIVIGEGAAATEFCSFLSKRPWLGVGCAGTIPVKAVAFSLERLNDILPAGKACELVLALDPEDHEDYSEVTQVLERAGLPFRIVPSLFEESFRATVLNGYGELPIINVDADPLDRVQHTTKRVLDVAISAAVLLLLSPLFGVIALAVKLDSRGPVIFKQERVGLSGRRFNMLKFRTMVDGAENKLQELLERNEADGHLFKIRDDPRVTRVGRILRRWSLDELPQFVNAFWGEMSVVGPRPPLPIEVEAYETQHFCRLRGKPGITGLWQVSGRSNLTFDEMVKLDRYYLEKWSTGLDLTIMARTIWVVLARRGAC